jgi:asparagine synthase (glutamine-hydrolysing)
MCGINGITEKDESVLKKMMQATSHRGPDATDSFFNEGISLGHNRLSVIDLSSAANQPMHSEDGRYSIVFNGEIYNYRELKSEIGLRWDFKTHGDTEVLLAGYALWGMEVLTKVKGIFAFALWDATLESLILVRDHMGVKPLYYTVQKETLFFSSELGGIIEGTNLRTLDHDALSHYITLNYVPSPMTLVAGIQKLEPGTLLRFMSGTSRVERYFTPIKPSEKNEHTTKALRAVIGEGVERQLVSDRPLGVFLSGGLDSSIVLHHTAEHITKVKTFSVDFEMAQDMPQSELIKFNSDARLASQTAEKYGTDHTTFTLSLSDVRSELHNALACLDEPIANPTSVSQYLLSKWVREKGVVVALGGDGGDELFGGYTRHRIALASWYLKKFPQLAQNTASLFSSQIQKLRVPFGTDFHMQVLGLKPSKYKELFRTDIDITTSHDFFAERYNAPLVSLLSPVDAFMRVDRESWLCDESLARTDRTSMAFGVEARVPLLDTDIVAYADSIVGHTKFKPWSNKKILRDAYRGHLPEYLFSEPKRGWLSPGAKWFRDPIIKKYVGEVLSSQYYGGLDAVVNWDEVQKMFAHHTDGGGYHLYPLWNILQLQVWAKKYNIKAS